MLTLLSETAELALDLIEKNGSILPFCKARTQSGEIVVISPEDQTSESIESANESVRDELKKRIRAGEIAEFAVCAEVEVKFSHEAAHQRALKIEFQNGTGESAVYYFPLLVEDGSASVGSYSTSNLPEKLL